VRLWRIAFAVACAVNLAVLYSPRAAGAGIPYADKITHALLFAAVAYTGIRIRLPLIWLSAALVLNAVVSELVQHTWLTNRSGDVTDAVADVAGAALGVLLAGGWRSRAT
jgi:VanZ family protein